MLPLHAPFDEAVVVEKLTDEQYDLSPIPSARVSDLSKVRFLYEYLPTAFASDILEQNNRSYEELLASCKMIAVDHGDPTVLGLLAVGNKPQEHLPGAYIQFLRMDGNDLADEVTDSEKIDGTLVDMVRRTEEKLRAHNRVAVNITSGPTHRIDKLYPHRALQQILYNAVLHRTYESANAPIHVQWYDDRIEIISPGGPYGHVTPENLGEPGFLSYRNPNIADLMKTFGLVEAFGRGIRTARDEMLRNGNPPPEFIADRSHVRCILPGKTKS